MSDFGIDVEPADGGLAWLVLRNPARHNALRIEMWRRLPDCLVALDADTAVRVVVVRGAGAQSFASGADIGEFETHRADPAATAEYERVTERAFQSLLGFSKPLIAMIRGAASPSRSAPTCASRPTMRASRSPPRASASGIIQTALRAWSR
jgi:enoyl-CoA hydratase/carnithine racemase